MQYVFKAVTEILTTFRETEDRSQLLTHVRKSIVNNSLAKENETTLNKKKNYGISNVTLHRAARILA